MRRQVRSAKHGFPGKAWFARFKHLRNTPAHLALFDRCAGLFRHVVLDAHSGPADQRANAREAVVQAFLWMVRDQPAADALWVDLAARAAGRLDRYFDECWAAQQSLYAEDLSGEGEWTLDEAPYRAAAHAALRLHLEELDARLELRHPQTGASLAGELEPIGLLGLAWHDVRPAIHPGRLVHNLPSRYVLPDGTFQVEFDAVYHWSGPGRIVALHTEPKVDQYTPEIVDRLIGLAYLATERGHTELGDLEVWMLGQSERVLFDPPTPKELAEFERKHHNVLRRVLVARHASEAREALFEAQPRAAWDGSHCEQCPARLVCPKGDHPRAKDLQTLGSLFPGCPPEHALQGRVLGISAAKGLGSHEARAVSVATAEGAHRLIGPAKIIESMHENGLRVGAWVRLSRLYVRKKSGGKPSYYVRPTTKFECLNFEPETP
jgi:hypothetical protein